jgi:hypothetical protein
VGNPRALAGSPHHRHQRTAARLPRIKVRDPFQRSCTLETARVDTIAGRATSSHRWQRDLRRLSPSVSARQWSAASRVREHLELLPLEVKCGQTPGTTSHAWDPVQTASARDREQGLAQETSGRETPAKAQGMSDPESRAAARGLAETGRVRVAAEESWTTPEVWP